MKPSLTLVSYMRDVPLGLRPRLRELSLGMWEPWGFWGWTLHDGSTWAALSFDGDTTRADRLVGWAALTLQIDVIPVVGVYVDARHRRGGRAEVLLRALLGNLLAGGIVHAGDTIAAATQRWPKYPEIIAGMGMRCVTWGADAPAGPK